MRYYRFTSWLSNLEVSGYASGFDPNVSFTYPGPKIRQAHRGGYKVDTFILFLTDPLKILPDLLKFLPDPLKFLPDFMRIRYVGISFVAAEMGLADF